MSGPGSCDGIYGLSFPPGPGLIATAWIYTSIYGLELRLGIYGTTCELPRSFHS
jgi:hypothetical protein